MRLRDEVFLFEMAKLAMPLESPDAVLGKAKPGDIVLTWPRDPQGSTWEKFLFLKLGPWAGEYSSARRARSPRGSHSTLYAGDGKILDLRGGQGEKRLREKQMLSAYPNHEITIVRPHAPEAAKQQAIQYHRSRRAATYDYPALFRFLSRRVRGPRNTPVDRDQLEKFVCSTLIATSYQPAIPEFRPGVGPLETLPIDFHRSRRTSLVARTRTGEPPSFWAQRGSK